ncbi:MAG: phage protease [Shimia sp.]
MTLPANLSTIEPLALNFEGGSDVTQIMLLPAGPRVEGVDGRAWQLTDPQRLVNAFNRAGRPIPIDTEHATHLRGARGEEAPARGWVTSLAVVDGAIWGQVEWTEAGRAMVANREYRFVSPVFTHDKASGRIERLRSVGLTNLPNLHMEALNRAADPDTKENAMGPDLTKALGLAEGADEAQAVAAIEKLKGEKDTAMNRAATPDPAKFVPRADYDHAMNRVSAFEAEAKMRLEAEITGEVEKAIADGKVAPASKEYHLAACRADGGLEAFRAMIGGAPSITQPSGLDKAAGGAAKTPALAEDELAMCRQLGIDPDAYAAQKKADEVAA